MLSYRKEMHLLPPYQLGEAFTEEMKRLGITRVVRLNSNEGPLPPFPAAIEAMQNALVDLNRYPDPTGVELRSMLSEKYGVPAQGIILGGGAVTLIRLVCLVLLSEGDEILMGWPMFPPYLGASIVLGAAVRKIPLLPNLTHDLPAMLDAVTEKTRVVVICNPNNPTGTVVSKAALDEYFRRVPDHVMTVLDEAYIEYANGSGTASGLEYINSGKSIVIFRSFSKAYGLAGARIGYALTSPETAQMMGRAQEGFPVNHVAQAGAMASLGCEEELRERVRSNADGRTYLETGFNRLGLKHAKSAANFVFVDVERDSIEMFHKLMTQGVLVRPGATYSSPSYLRVTVGTPEENEIFLEALGRTL